jgi:hypothetical protein
MGRLSRTWTGSRREDDFEGRQEVGAAVREPWNNDAQVQELALSSGLYWMRTRTDKVTDMMVQQCQ